jgi:hypothetical protein
MLIPEDGQQILRSWEVSVSMLSSKTAVNSFTLFALLGAVGTVQAATINVSGVVSGSQGTVGPAGVGQVFTQNVHLSNGNDTVRGTLEVANRLVGSQQQMSVRFTDLILSTVNTNTDRLFSIVVEQDFAISNQAISNTASATQTFAATSNMIREGQSWSAQAQAFHEGVEIARLSFDSPLATYANSWAGGWKDVELGTTAARNITVAGAYRIRTVYTFVLTSNPACDWMAVEFNPDSQWHDGLDRLGSSAHLAIVPLPPAAWAGIGGLGIVGIAAKIRRRKLEAAEATE